MPMLTGILAAMGGSPDFQIEYYKLGDEEKSVTSVMGVTSAIYTKGDIHITCTEGSPLGLISSTTKKTVSCKTSPVTSQFSPEVGESILNQTNITYNGVKQIIGRNCDHFTIVLSTSELTSLPMASPITGMAAGLESEISEKEGQVIYEVCMDKQYGYPAFINASLESHSVLSGKSTITNIFSFEATHMSTDVTLDDMKIPVKFLINELECEENLVDLNITSLESFAGPTINIDLSSYSQNMSLSKTVVSLNEGETYSFDIIPTTSIDTSYYTAEVCIGDDCQSDYCYVSRSYNP